MAILVLKPLTYWGVFSFARAWSRPRPSPALPIAATALRLLGGIVLGIPTALLLLRLGPTPLRIFFTAFRFALWSLVLLWVFDRMPRSRVPLLAGTATAINLGFDLLIWGSHWTHSRIFGGC